jgi:formamidopyrimidine-DNA glycosylase
VLHFGMTGWLRYSRKEREAHPYGAARFYFKNDAVLEYIMPRKLGRIAVTDSVSHFVAERRLGPDALAVDEAEFVELAGGPRGRIKSWLMNQKVIAGIGNVRFRGEPPGTARGVNHRAEKKRA